MSGLTQRQGGGTFVTGKNGKFFLSTDKDLESPYDELTGKIVGIVTREGKFGEEDVLTVQDSEGNNYKLTLKVGSGSWGRLVGFLKNADLTKELTIVPMGDEQDDGRIFTTYLVQQFGIFLKGFYSKDSGNSLPAWKKVRVNGKDVYDKEDWTNALKADVEELRGQIEVPGPSPVQEQSVDTGSGADEDEYADSDLPF